MDKPAIPVEPKTFTQLTSFTHPATWTSGTGRNLLESWGEGRNIQLTGYVFEADNYTGGKETTNCSLGTSDYNDFHIVLVEGLTLANKSKAADDKVKEAEDAVDAAEDGGNAADIASAKAKLIIAKDKAKTAHKKAEKRSLTAEISPRLRPNVAPVGSGSASDRIISLLRKYARELTYVRVTGWAMLDTQHIDSPINRRSNWELHPVTKFELCTAAIADCDAGTGWTNIEVIP
ncbi:MAG: cell envelope integrity protein TolA [Pyrinomonadaceae bacterium]